MTSRSRRRRRSAATCPTVDVAGEPLAEYAQGDKPVAIADLSQAKGKLFERMAARGAKSSLHVPVVLGGQRATINFWSTDPAAFPQPAVQLLSALSQAMAAPKPPAGQQAAAK